MELITQLFISIGIGFVQGFGVSFVNHIVPKTIDGALLGLAFAVCTGMLAGIALPLGWHGFLIYLLAYWSVYLYTTEKLPAFRG